jgi:hypothetical protein
MIKFKYTKANGEISNRTGVVIASPSKHYSMFDLSDLTEDEQATFCDIYEQYLEEKKALLEELDSKYAMSALIKKYFKNFNPEGIKDVETK